MAGIAGAALPAAAAPCPMGIGWRVVLASDAVDPDVFLWDSRDRLVEYTAGRWGSAKAVFAHTTLAPSGTVAVIISCAAGAARAQYTSWQQDVIGVKIVRGQFRGRYGWVLSSDAHPQRVLRASRS